MNTRLEHDFLGTRKIPYDAYYGIQTLRAMENFYITGVQISSNPELIQALAYVKKAAAKANAELGVLSQDICDAICKACNEIIMGRFHDQFPLDCMQGGAGTSTNMNANEVIANRALEILGHQKGEYEYCHPNNHVNCSQSTNDVYPTAFRLALYAKLMKLIDDIGYLRDGFTVKANEFHDVIKMGRTQLQDAVPMTLGMEFGAYATTLTEDMIRLDEAAKLVLEVNMGATAIGTGINSPKGYSKTCLKYLREVTNLDIQLSVNLIEATWDTGAYVQVSGMLKRNATKVSKICNDLRLLSSGPRTGFNEINLPQMQPGSSIMPGKVNPVVPEVVNQVCFDIIGKDITITLAAEAGQLELNVMEPVIGFALFTGIERLRRAVRTLQDRCICGITANRERCRSLVENSIGIVTALTPYIGYEACAEIAREALATDASVCDLVLQKKLLTREELDEILSLSYLINGVK